MSDNRLKKIVLSTILVILVTYLMFSDTGNSSSSSYRRNNNGRDRPNIAQYGNMDDETLRRILFETKVRKLKEFVEKQNYHTKGPRMEFTIQKNDVYKSTMDTMLSYGNIFDNFKEKGYEIKYTTGGGISNKDWLTSYIKGAFDEKSNLFVMQESHQYTLNVEARLSDEVINEYKLFGMLLAEMITNTWSLDLRLGSAVIHGLVICDMRLFEEARKPKPRTIPAIRVNGNPVPGIIKDADPFYGRIAAIKLGIHTVIPIDLFSFFTALDLQRLLNKDA